jgi:O-antigen chain-terminating methyltransferase
MDANLQAVHNYIPVGLATPASWARFRGLRGKVILLMARCVRYLARVVTNDQRAFNQAAFNVLCDLKQQIQAIESRQKAILEEYETALDSLEARVGPLSDGVEGMTRRLTRSETDLRVQQRRLITLMEELRKSAAEPLAQRLVERAQQWRPGDLDRLYADLEDRFRGSRADIKQRLLAYLPLLRDANLGTAERPLLDLGCGRGEWLELLAEQGLHARGVDCNAVFLQECRQAGLDVCEGDVPGYLRSLPDGCLGAVSAFHLVECLPFPVLVEMLDEIVRVLVPGGLVLFETPNPENMMVGRCTFHIHPTHQRPLFGQTLQFLAENRGLERVEVRPVNQHPDYALIGWKP